METKQVAVEDSASTSSFSAFNTITASLKENGPRLTTTCLQKPQHDVINFFLRWKDERQQDSKLMKRSQNFGFSAEKKKKKKKKRTFRPQLVSADGSLL